MKRKNDYYHNYIENFLKSNILSNSNILEIGCRAGDRIGILNPKEGLGMDIDKNILEIAKRKYPDIEFQILDLNKLKSSKKFDFILLINQVDRLKDIYSVLKKLRNISQPTTKLIITSLNPLYLIPIYMNEKLKIRKAQKPRNWTSLHVILNLLKLSNFRVLESGALMPFPKKIPFSKSVNFLFDRVLKGKFKHGAIQYVIAFPDQMPKKKEYSYSVIVPCYNEEGNVEACAKRTPNFGKNQEIIFVNDGSKDRTAEKVKEIMKTNKRIKLVDYPNNQGKGYATKMGLDAAKNDILMILDADMTVRPEDLPKFVEPFENGQATFVNGTRLVYPLQGQAMRSLHIIGNKMFSLIFSYLLNRRVTDTLCGTKVFFRKDYQKFKMQDKSWPDFDLLFGAAKLKLRMVEMPIEYQERTAGESKMKTFKHGSMLLKACVRGFKELKLKL
jgi:ubiquinone/menaquinone biosynthesis C-methylase UbiE